MAFDYFNYGAITANGTTSWGGQGSRLFAITITDPGTAWVLTVTDGGAGGPAIATIRPTAPVTLFFRAVVIFGIGVVASGTTAGSATILYT